MSKNAFTKTENHIFQSGSTIKELKKILINVCKQVVSTKGNCAKDKFFGHVIYSFFAGSNPRNATSVSDLQLTLEMK